MTGFYETKGKMSFKKYYTYRTIDISSKKKQKYNSWNVSKCLGTIGNIQKQLGKWNQRKNFMIKENNIGRAMILW